MCPRGVRLPLDAALLLVFMKYFPLVCFWFVACVPEEWDSPWCRVLEAAARFKVPPQSHSCWHESGKALFKISFFYEKCHISGTPLCTFIPCFVWIINTGHKHWTVWKIKNSVVWNDMPLSKSWPTLVRWPTFTSIIWCLGWDFMVVVVCYRAVTTQLYLNFCLGAQWYFR